MRDRINFLGDNIEILSTGRRIIRYSVLFKAYRFRSNSTLGYQRNRSTPHASFINVLIRVYPRRSLPTIALVTYISSESLKLLVEILKLFSGINLRGEFLSSRTRNVYRSRKRILIGFRSLLENNHTGELRKKYSGVTEFTLFLENNTSGQEIKYRTSTE